jgi:hypothetical protein
MDVSNASYFILNEKGNKASQMGQTKKYLKKKKVMIVQSNIICLNYIYKCLIKINLFSDSQEKISDLTGVIQPAGKPQSSTTVSAT